MIEKARQYLGIKPFWFTIQSQLPIAFQDQLMFQIGPDQIEYNIDLYNEVLSYADILLNLVSEITGMADIDPSVFLRDKNSTLFESVAKQTSAEILEKFKRFQSSEPMQKIKHADLVNRDYDDISSIEVNVKDIQSIKTSITLERKSLEDKRERIINVIGNHQKVKQVAERILKDLKGEAVESEVTETQPEHLNKSANIKRIMTGSGSSHANKSTERVKIMRPLSQIPKKKLDLLEDLQ